MRQGSDAERATAANREELIERAKELVPTLRERAAKAEELRRLPDETVRDFHDTGLFRMLQPARFGGAEMDYGILIDIDAQIGRACGSSAWVLANLASHHWMLAMWPEQAQHEVWGQSPDALIASGFIFPAGRATAADGGYWLTGRWPFASGIDHSEWVMLGALVHSEREDVEPEYRMFLAPKSDLEVIDTWYAAGLRGTGSNDVAAQDVFVPEHRTLAVADSLGGGAPGSVLNPAPVYRLPILALFSFVVGSAALGIAYGALETFVEVTRSRVASYSRAKVAGYASVQLKVAEAAALVDAAELLMHRGCAEVMRISEAGGVPTIEQKVRYRRDGAFATSLCTRAVDLLFAASGGGGVYDRNPIQRAFRDVHAASAHIALSWDVAGTLYGRVALGLPSDNPTI